jgi:hypothetical protein
MSCKTPDSDTDDRELVEAPRAEESSTTQHSQNTIWRNYYDSRIGLRTSENGEDIALVAEEDDSLRLSGPACGFTLDRWAPLTHDERSISETSYLARHPWRRMGWLSTISCTLEEFHGKRVIRLNSPFTFNSFFKSITGGGNKPVVVPAGIYRIRFKEITHEGTIEVIVRVSHKQSLKVIRRATRLS